MKTINDDLVKWPSLKKYPCKKLKGKHDFVLDKVIPPYEMFKHYPSLYKETYIYHCSACGKLKYK